MKCKFIPLLLLLVFVLGKTCKDKVETDPDVFKGTSQLNKYQANSPMGVRVASGQKIAPASLVEIDKGLDKLFSIVSQPPYSYQNNMFFGAYKVWLAPRSNRCTQAGFLVNGTGSPYEGTIYDKDPRPNVCTLCVAGMMMLEGLLTGPGPLDGYRPGMVVVDDQGTLANAVRYEGEHNILLWNDQPWFTRTQYHTEGAGHPIIPDATGNRSATTDERFTPATLTLPVDVEGVKAGTPVCLILTK